MRHRCFGLVATIAVHTNALAPSFDAFSAAATGSWHGTQYEWPGDTNGVACETVVDEVMRSCGGAVQGVRVDDGPLLNRQDDGFCFFDCGSWTQGPTKLTDGALNLDVGLVAQSGSRVRCSAAVDYSAGHVVDATVVVEEKAGAAPLAKRQSLAATGAPWLAPRLKWTRAAEATTMPADALALPGGVSIACVDNNGATDVVVHADDVSLTRSYDASGALVAISLHAPSPQDD